MASICSNPPKANGATCSDSNACTTADTCVSGACVAGASAVCNDSNPCTVDGCSTVSGCTFTPGNAGAPCGSPASCTVGSATPAVACNGLSSLCPTPIVKNCAPFACGTTTCITSCAQDGDCAQGNYCAVGGQCTPKGNPGGSCSAGNQCLSSFCADGVCCNNDCLGQCEACNVSGSVGVCTAVVGAPEPPRPACVGDGTGCDGTCNGIVTTSCTVPGQSTQCRPPSCNPTMQRPRLLSCSADARLQAGHLRCHSMLRLQHQRRLPGGQLLPRRRLQAALRSGNPVLDRRGVLERALRGRGVLQQRLHGAM